MWNALKSFSHYSYCNGTVVHTYTQWFSGTWCFFFHSLFFSFHILLLFPFRMKWNFFYPHTDTHTHDNTLWLHPFLRKNNNIYLKWSGMAILSTCGELYFKEFWFVLIWTWIFRELIQKVKFSVKTHAMVTKLLKQCKNLSIS